ncbi:Helix-turn-helix protein [Streptomyces sp. ADI96-02]|uniref:helix-turn-helix domain-containing protein n=1 Tax=Streptomyces sp. ADI96-02 TaxID=1522760 RepID=UPI000F559777|nr:helix-turn-helix transcriptional regulator [Streptomyces sp. ADI96-02]RPK59581.1 Helix-turn-helix protein [Streptomyces sp. ADI96-02]
MTFEPESLGQSRSDLAQALRSERKRAGLTQTRLAQRANMSQTKISNIEARKLTPTIVDVELIVDALGADGPVATQMLALARAANTEWQDDWASQRRGLDKKQNELARLEVVTAEFRFFLPTMITGLLATPDYVRASLSRNSGDMSRTVAKKLERQQILMDPSKHFTFLLTEQAVRWPLASPIAMAMQLDRLVSVSRIPNVRLGVIPLDIVGPVSETPLSVFTVYDRRMVQVETHTGALILRDHRDVSTYREDFERYESHAVFGEACRSLLDDWASAFTRQRK